MRTGIWASIDRIDQSNGSLTIIINRPAMHHAPATARAPRVCTFINPRSTCAARVTVVVLCVCLSVHAYSLITGYEAAYERYQHLQCHKGTRNKLAILLKRLRSRDMARKQAKKPICIMSTGLPRPRLARSAHRGRMKLLRGYVSKSSAV